MATIDATGEQLSGLTGFQTFQGIKRQTVIELDVDLSDTSVWPAGLAASAADVGQLYDLPAGVMVDSCVIYVDATDGAVDPEGTDLDVGLVDTASIAASNVLNDAANITSIATTNYFEGTGGRGVFCDIPKSIVIVNNDTTAMTVAKFKLLITTTDFISQNNTQPGVSTG